MEGGIPIDFTLYQWRKMMNVSYTDMLDTPIHTIYQDLDFNKIEAQVKELKEQQQNAIAQ